MAECCELTVGVVYEIVSTVLTTYKVCTSNGKSIVTINKHTNANIAPQKVLDAQHIESRFGI